MPKTTRPLWMGMLLWLFILACVAVRQTPMPVAPVEQIAFEVQTATPTYTPVLILADVATYTPDPNATLTPSISGTLTATLVATPTATVAPLTASEPAAAPALPTATTEPPPALPTMEPLRGGAWDFEDGFMEWANPYGDVCPGSGLAIGWTAFTSRDQYGSSCMNQTNWQGNVYSGESAQELTFAYVGVEAGLYKTAPTIPGHQYTIEAFMKREFSVAPVQVFLGVDLSGTANWEAETIQWFPWDEDLDDTWARTEETVTASGESMTIFIKGSHSYPEPGGTLRVDAISITDLGPAP